MRFLYAQSPAPRFQRIPEFRRGPTYIIPQSASKRKPRSEGPGLAHELRSYAGQRNSYSIHHRSCVFAGPFCPWLCRSALDAALLRLRSGSMPDEIISAPYYRLLDFADYWSSRLCDDCKFIRLACGRTDGCRRSCFSYKGLAT